MGLIIILLVFCFTAAGLVLLCFYAPCLRDHVVSAKRAARRRRRHHQLTELATVAADAAAARRAIQCRGIANPLVPPDYTEEPAGVPGQGQLERGRRHPRPCLLEKAGQLVVQDEPPPGYSRTRHRQPGPMAWPQRSGQTWQQLDPALCLLGQTGWRRQDDPPPQYTETQWQPAAASSQPQHRAAVQPHQPDDVQTFIAQRQALAAQQCQRQWEQFRAAAVIHERPPAYSTVNRPQRQHCRKCDFTYPGVCPLGETDSLSAKTQQCQSVDGTIAWADVALD